MVTRVGVLGVIMAVAFLLQATLLELIRFYIKPDLVLILVIFFALINGSKPGSDPGRRGGGCLKISCLVVSSG